MNLERRGDGVSLRLDLKAIRALLADYFARDLWPSVESPLGKTKLSFLVGGASRVLSSEDLERLAAAAAATPERVEVRVIEGAGHWVHVDAPDAVLDALRGTV
jgi:pimeloyl-ACP methyl ester carboxylesterase